MLKAMWRIWTLRVDILFVDVMYSLNAMPDRKHTQPIDLKQIHRIHRISISLIGVRNYVAGSWLLYWRRTHTSEMSWADRLVDPQQ